MIELSLTAAFIMYLSLTLLALLGIWGWQHWKKKTKVIAQPPKELFVCEYCHFAYLFDSNKKVNQCPQCFSYNKENRFTKKSS